MYELYTEYNCYHELLGLSALLDLMVAGEYTADENDFERFTTAVAKFAFNPKYAQDLRDKLRIEYTAVATQEQRDLSSLITTLRKIEDEFATVHQVDGVDIYVAIQLTGEYPVTGKPVVNSVQFRSRIDFPEYTPTIVSDVYKSAYRARANMVKAGYKVTDVDCTVLILDYAGCPKLALPKQRPMCSFWCDRKGICDEVLYVGYTNLKEADFSRHTPKVREMMEVLTFENLLSSTCMGLLDVFEDYLMLDITDRKVKVSSEILRDDVRNRLLEFLYDSMVLVDVLWEKLPNSVEVQTTLLYDLVNNKIYVFKAYSNERLGTYYGELTVDEWRKRKNNYIGRP